MIGDDPQEETKATNSGLIPVLAKNPRIQIVAILLSVLLALGGLITFLVVDSERKPADEYAGCVTSHETYNQTSEAPLGTYSRFAVAADNKLCSTVGRNILERGGSAVDAAIASGLCNSVMNAQSMGIGGGHFMVIYKKSENKSYIIDAREAAPLNSHKDMFVNDSQKALIGGLATAIPGEIYGYWKAYQIGGQLPWSELFEPTIRLCEEGYIVSKSLAGALREKQSLIKANSGLSEVFIDPNTGSVYKEGDTARRPKLVNTFRILAQYGAEAFYNGVLTPLIVNEINKNGGNVSLRDFNIYEPRVHEDRFLIRLDSNLRLYTAPPPSSGILVPTVIRIMKKFQLDNFNSMTNSSWNLFYHRLAEAFKHVYSKRTYFGDEQFTDMTQILDELVSQSYIDEIAAKINDKKTYPTSYYGSARFWEDHGTAHISVIAPNGDAVSLTSTINNYFGGKYAGDDTGIIYCDIMDDFSTPGVVNSFGFVPSEANHIEPQKRPLSSMSPIIVVDNDDNVRLVLGSSGGSKIISSVAQVALRTLFLGMDIKSAIDERRIHHQLYPNNAQLEAGFPKFVTNHLRKIGHETTCFSFGGSTVQGIQVRDQRILAYSDPRKGGQPDGI